MHWKLHDKEYANVLTLPAAERYQYAIGKLGDWREAYSLKGPAGWVLAGDDAGREGVPIWPHQRYAEACAVGAWAGSKAEPIPFDAWLERWLPGLSRDNRFVAVFPTPGGQSQGVAVEPQAHGDHLRAELAKYDE